MAEIFGDCDARFGKVKDAFARNFDEAGEIGAGFAVYHKGRKVIDLWGGEKGRPGSGDLWEEGNIINFWSTTKGIVAAAMAKLLGEGAFSYEEPVAKYWPEFAAEGKGDITIAQILSHQAGLNVWREDLPLDALYDWDRAAGSLAAQAPWWQPGSQSGYHAVTYGYLAGEIIRRLSGQSVGAYVRDQLLKPLEIDNQIFIGVPEDQDHRVATILGPDGPPMPVDEDAPEDIKLTFARPPFGPISPRKRDWRAAEIPAANGHGTARGLARLYAAMAAGGVLDGGRIIETNAMAQAVTPVIAGPDRILVQHTTWGHGFIMNGEGPKPYGPNRGSFGHSGWGGSFGYADMAEDISVGYVMNQMQNNLQGDPRTMTLLQNKAMKDQQAQYQDDPERGDQSYRRWLSRRYLLALMIIGGLTVIGLLIFQRSQELTEEAGRQTAEATSLRIMVQGAGVIARGISDEESKEVLVARQNALADLLQRIDQVHQRQTAMVEQDGSGALKAIYFSDPVQLDQQLTLLKADIRFLLAVPAEDMPDQTKVIDRIVDQSATSLSDAIRAAIRQNADDYQIVQRRFVWAEFGVFVAIIAVLALEAIVIFRPMVNRVVRHASDLRRLTDDLEATKDSLEEEVVRRTKAHREAQSDAEAANQAKSRFLAAASHDLQQPLSAMGMFLGALDRNAGDETRIRPIIEDLRGAQQSMKRLLTSMLDMSQIEAGTIQVSPEHIAIGQLFRQLEAEYRMEASAKGLTFDCPETDLVIWADPVLLERILRNLLSNAVRYTRAGRVWMEIKAKKESLEIAVCDTGPGMSESELEAAFQEFHQLDDPARDRSEGLGLGLTICWRLALLMGHDLKAESEPGKGSRFTISVPLATSGAASNRGQEVAAE
ncbi:lact-2 [Symbiodinium microadriaticum]|nr:lact-2 [Symbiodinium microadriaticum]